MIFNPLSIAIYLRYLYTVLKPNMFGFKKGWEGLVNKQTQGKINRVLTILLWILALYLLFFTSFWYLAAFIFGLHLVELFLVGFKKGKQAGASSLMTVVLVLVFGFTWWLYLEPS